MIVVTSTLADTHTRTHTHTQHRGCLFFAVVAIALVGFDGQVFVDVEDADGWMDGCGHAHANTRGHMFFTFHSPSQHGTTTTHTHKRKEGRKQCQNCGKKKGTNGGRKKWNQSYLCDPGVKAFSLPIRITRWIVSHTNSGTSDHDVGSESLFFFLGKMVFPANPVDSQTWC